MSKRTGVIVSTVSLFIKWANCLYHMSCDAHKQCHLSDHQQTKMWAYRYKAGQVPCKVQRVCTIKEDFDPSKLSFKVVEITYIVRFVDLQSIYNYIWVLCSPRASFLVHIAPIACDIYTLPRFHPSPSTVTGRVDQYHGRLGGVCLLTTTNASSHIIVSSILSLTLRTSMVFSDLC